MFANTGCVPKARIDGVSNWGFSLLSFVVVHCSIENRAAVPPGVKDGHIRVWLSVDVCDGSFVTTSLPLTSVSGDLITSGQVRQIYTWYQCLN